MSQQRTFTFFAPLFSYKNDDFSHTSKIDHSTISNAYVILLIITFSLMLFSCNPAKKVAIEETLPFYNTAEFEAEWIAEKDSNYRSIHTIANFEFTNQLGHTINNDALAGHIYVANFFFSICPSICPKMVENLHKLQTTFADNSLIKMVSFSVMPWVDSVARLKKYGEIHKINPSKWYLLTGPKEKIYELGRKSFFAEKGLGLQKNNKEFLHTETMLLIDKKGRIRGVYSATQPTDIERITEDIKVLLKE